MKTGFQVSTGDIDEQLIKRTALVYIGVILLFLVAIGFVLPWFGEVAKIKAEFKKAEVKTKEMSQGLALLDSTGEMITEIDQEMLGRVLPVVFSPGTILGGLRNLSQNEGVSIVEYSLAGGSLEEVETKKTNALRSVQLKVRVVGTTSGVMSFMKKVEESVPLASVVEVSVGEVAKIIGGSSGGMVKLVLTVDYYNLPIGIMDKLTMSKYVINEKDLATLLVLKGYQQGQISTGVSVPGGNQNLFGD